MDKYLNVLIVADFSAPSPGAFIQSLASLGKRITGRGGQIAFLFPTKHDYHSLLQLYGPVFVCNKWIRGKRVSLPLISYAYRICRTLKVNIVHTQFGLASPLCGCVLSVVADVKHVWHWRNPPKSLARQTTYPWRIFLARIFYCMINLLGRNKHVAISQDIALNLVSNGFIHRNSIVVVHNSINLQGYVFGSKVSSKVQSRLGLKWQGRAIIGMIANFGIQKDQETLIKALAIIKRQIPEVLLLLVGDSMVGQGPERKKSLRSMIHRLDLDDNVIFTGQWHPVSEIIGCFDVGILASHWEGFGNVIVEYMAMEKPVVATRVGGIPEIVIDGETGFLVEPHGPSEMAKRIIDLLSNSELRNQMGRNGRKRAEKDFSIDRWTEEICQVYRQVNVATNIFI